MTALRFNEAAALHRGKLGNQFCSDSLPARFNEAAALHRGKPGESWGLADLDAGFNEAAALHRGKRAVRAAHARRGRASMRPRHYTAENARRPVHARLITWLQ